jgi:hypothetical protein
MHKSSQSLVLICNLAPPYLPQSSQPLVLICNQHF